MKHNIYIALALATLTACQLLKKEKLTVKAQYQKEVLQLTEHRNLLSQQNQLILIDSSHNDFTMMLYPKGRFTFSVANGFEGEAEKILINGKHTRQKIINLKQEIKKDSSVFKANYANEKESSASVKKNKLSVGCNWSLLLIIPVFYFLYLIYKRYKQLTG